jgi:hypothetical protein
LEKLVLQNLGAATLIQNDTCQVVFDETKSPKRLEKSVLQHLVTVTLIQNDTCQFVFDETELPKLLEKFGATTYSRSKH